MSTTPRTSPSAPDGSAHQPLLQRALDRRSLLRGLPAAAAVAAVAGAAVSSPAAAASRTVVRRVTSPVARPAIFSSRGLTVTSDIRVSDRLWDFRFRTAAMTLFEPSIRVILPNGYDQNPGRRYPVLLLLHGGHPEGGMNGNFLDWTLHGGIADRETVGQDVIIVCPDGGNGRFYVNWKGPQGATVNWEEFHIPQLMNWMDDNFRTIVGWKTKAVAGLSMGGYGALTYAARNPDVFSSASAYSGPCDVFDAAVNADMTVSPVADGQSPGSIFQGDSTMMQLWNPRSPVLVEVYRQLRVYVSSGDGATNQPPADIQEIAVRGTMDAFTNDLRVRGIGFTYNRMPYATHDWVNWRDNFHRDLPGILGSLPHQ